MVKTLKNRKVDGLKFLRRKLSVVKVWLINAYERESRNKRESENR